MQKMKTIDEKWPTNMSSSFYLILSDTLCKGSVIFNGVYPPGAYFKGSEIFYPKIKGSEIFLEFFKGS